MRSGLGRLAVGVVAPMAFCAAIGAAAAADCPGHPDAIGTSRTIAVDPRDHTRIGTMDYAETLPLADHEVVLTFDDGPLPPYSGRILDILASQCVKATYFMVGEMAKAYPAMAQRVYDAGHSIGTHSYSHPIHFRRETVEQGNAQIDDGIAAATAALGDAGKLSPFFRFPGFGHTEAAEQHLASLGVMTWGADAPADDWKRISPKEIARRAIGRLERKGKGILLLHDIHERTVEALPIILDELKSRGFRIVHVIAASPDHPATVTAAADWLPHSRQAPRSPVILLADVQDPEGDGLGSRTAAELCQLNPPRETTGTATARRIFRKHLRHAHSGSHRFGSMRSGAKYAHAEAPRSEFDWSSSARIHAVR